MMSRKEEPEIRFKGFTDPWKKQKLGDCFSERVENMPDGELISVTIKDGIKKATELGRRDNSNADKSKYKKVCIGDIAYNSMRMWQGASGYSPYEGIVSPAYTVLAPKTGINSKCLAYLFKLPETIHAFKINSQGITSDTWNLKYPALSRIDIFVPGDEQEQTKIAKYFENVDNLIDFHQQKYEKLRDFKKAMLCNMFPAAEANAPKVRFKDYTKPWKRWALGELYTERKEAGNVDLPILSVSIHSGVSADELDSAELGKAVRRSEDKSLYKHTYKGDLVFNMMRAWQGAIGVVPKEGMVSPAYITAIPNDEVFPEFMDYCLRREEVINQINNLSYGVTDFRKRLYWDSFVRVQIMLPSVEEQKKIAETLVQLDKLIELQSAKVEKLKNLKAACLEKMFV